MSERTVSLRLKSGEPVLLRPIGPQDATRLREGIAQLSDHSRYLRFFTGARTMPQAVLDRLVDVDGHRHIAWGALDLSRPGLPAIGAGHAIRKQGTTEAELALAVLDAYHGKGVARLLLAAVIADSLDAGITRLTAETLSENTAARQLFRAMGGVSNHREGAVVSYRFDAALADQRLTNMGAGSAMAELRQSPVFAGRQALSKAG